MQTILADLTVSMSDFKRNPAKVLREAQSQPVAVLNHNKPAFYVVDPVLFAALMRPVEEAHKQSGAPPFDLQALAGIAKGARNTNVRDREDRF